MSKHCTACEELKQNAPHFTLNGITERECESLQNDTGLNNQLSVLRNNCEDLNDMLDCLVGALHEKLPAYDVCNIKDYIDQLMTNLYTLKKAMICSKCGQWKMLWRHDEQIRLLWEETRRLWAEIERVYQLLLREVARLDQRITALEEHVRREIERVIGLINDLRSEMLRLLTELETRVNNRMNQLILEAETRINDRITQIENTVNASNRALQIIVNNLRNSGAWSGTSTAPINPPVDIGGNLVTERNFATGNINLFGNAAGNRFIRTNSSNSNPQDIRGGLT